MTSLCLLCVHAFAIGSGAVQLPQGNTLADLSLSRANRGGHYETASEAGKLMRRETHSKALAAGTATEPREKSSQMFASADGLDGVLSAEKSLPTVYSSVKGMLQVSQNTHTHTMMRTHKSTPAAEWVKSLPEFVSKGALEKSPKWSMYLKQVYGPELNDVVFPFDLKSLHFFYTEYLHRAGFDGFPQNGTEGVKDLFRDVGHLDDLVEGDVYHGQLDGLAKYINVYRPSHKIFKNGSKVEVFHGRCQSDKTLRFGCHGVEPLYWMYWMPGTGVFYDVGRTIAFADHTNHEPESYRATDFLLKENGQNLDSIQYHQYREQYIYKFEIVDLRKAAAPGTRSYVCPLAVSAFSSQGQQCNCNEEDASKSINCKYPK